MNNNLKQLFELHLDYVENKKPITSPKGKVGKYIGSGVGEATGEKINGSVEWDLYESIDDGVCLTNFSGEIQTDDDSKILFDARGHGKIISPGTKPKDWVMVYGVKFDTKDQPYLWLNNTLGVWEGEFSAETYKHHYRVYAHEYSK